MTKFLDALLCFVIATVLCVSLNGITTVINATPTGDGSGSSEGEGSNEKEEATEENGNGGGDPEPESEPDPEVVPEPEAAASQSLPEAIVECSDGSTVISGQECPTPPVVVECEGTAILVDGVCKEVPKPFLCADGTVAPTEAECSSSSSVTVPELPVLPVEPETETETESEAETEVEPEPIDPCLLDPSDPSCPKPDPITGECPPGWNQNEDGNCFPEHDRCPEGYHSHEDDETGRCIPDSTPCEPGYITDPDFPTCSKKVDVCKKHPEIKDCKDGNNNGNNDNDDDGDTDVDVDIIIKNINKHETITKTVKHDRSTFPDVDIIGLSIKENGDSMICLLNIDKEHVQCQEFNVPNDRADSAMSRIIEVDSDKEYDNGNTGSSEIDSVIQNINDQDFNALEDADNHNFKVDLAALGVNDNGDGMVCIIDDDKSDKGKALCEPFKVADATAVSGQITEIIEFD